MLNNQNFTIVDVETTGGSPFFNRIIEIGILRVEKGEVVEEYKTLVNPDMAIPEFITKITGISDIDTVFAPRFEEIAEDILAKFEGNIFVAHNAQFDYGFFKEEFRRAGFAFAVPQLCTVRLSRALYKEHRRHNLSAIIERYNFECNNRHRAFDDAKVLWDFLQYAHAEKDSEDFNAAFQAVLKTPRILSKPPLIKKARLTKRNAVVEELTYVPESEIED